MLHSCFRVLYSKSGIRRKHAAGATQLRKRSHPASHPYKAGPLVRGNGGSTQDALEDKDKIPCISQPTKDRIKRLTGGVGRTRGSAEPGLQHIQAHIGEESRPRHLITFHMCIWRESTSTSINRASHPPLNTHTHTHTLIPLISKETLYLLLLAR